jgi:hypothetical protein
MGLLGTSWDDPNSQAIMALSAGLLRRDPGGGLLAANNAIMQAKQQAARDQYMQMQMEAQRMDLEERRRARDQELQIQDAARQSFLTPEKANSLSMGPMPGGAPPPNVQPGFDQRAFLQRLAPIAPMKAIEWEQKLAKDDSPLTVAPGASLVDRRTMKPVFTAPDKDSVPSGVKEYEYAVRQGYRGNYEQWAKDQKKAGANSVSLSVNTEKSLLNDIAGGLGKSITDARGKAEAAVGTIGTVNRLVSALDSGQVMAGPTSNFRQYGLQIGNVLGVAGKDATEKLMNTRSAIQSLAQLELDAAQAMKGQGQITEAERDIIRRAAAGDIERMTVPELRVLAGTLDKTARGKIRAYQGQVTPLKQNPNAAPLAPFLDVAEPEQMPQNRVRRFNPATGKIE